MSKAPNKISVFQMIYAGFYILVFPFLILFLSGDWLWPEGWIWDIWYITLCVVTVIYLYCKDPALLAERFKSPVVGFNSKPTQPKRGRRLVVSAQASTNQKNWDKVVLGLMIVGFLGWIVLTPLDAKRYGWSGDFPLGLKVPIPYWCGIGTLKACPLVCNLGAEVLGGLGLIPSFFFTFRAYTDNTFLSPLVRLQKERQQKVVTTGVYAIVRHPMAWAGY